MVANCSTYRPEICRQYSCQSCALNKFQIQIFKLSAQIECISKKKQRQEREKKRQTNIHTDRLKDTEKESKGEDEGERERGKPSEYERAPSPQLFD